MLIDAPADEALDVAIVVEDDAAFAAAWAAATHLRKQALSVEIIATGSPRKRFDRAVKKGASEILVLTIDGERVGTHLKSSGEARAQAALAGLHWPKPTPE